MKKEDIPLILACVFIVGVIFWTMCTLTSCSVKEIPARHKLSRCIKITEYDYVTQDRKDTFNTWTHYYNQFNLRDTIP